MVEGQAQAARRDAAAQLCRGAVAQVAATIEEFLYRHRLCGLCEHGLSGLSLPGPPSSPRHRAGRPHFKHSILAPPLRQHSSYHEEQKHARLNKTQKKQKESEA